MPQMTVSSDDVIIFGVSKDRYLNPIGKLNIYCIIATVIEIDLEATNCW